VYGFGGMRSDGEILSFNPSIPAHWKGYSFQVTYRGSVIRVEVSQGKAVLHVIEGGPARLKVAGQVQEVNRNGILVNI
jgi:maltose phosphorylase